MIAVTTRSIPSANPRLATIEACFADKVFSKDKMRFERTDGSNEAHKDAAIQFYNFYATRDGDHVGSADSGAGKRVHLFEQNF